MHRATGILLRHESDWMGQPRGRVHARDGGCLAKCGLRWTSDVTYADLPHRIATPHGVIAGVPTTDFSDNRVMRSNPRDLIDAHLGTLNYLAEREDMSLLTLVFHCQFGGRPLMTSAIREMLRTMSASRDVWFATHHELAQWALDSDADEHTYRSRFFAPPATTAEA